MVAVRDLEHFRVCVQDRLELVLLYVYDYSVVMLCYGGGCILDILLYKLQE